MMLSWTISRSIIFSKASIYIFCPKKGHLNGETRKAIYFKLMFSQVSEMGLTQENRNHV